MRQLHFFVPALNIPDQAAATAAGWTEAEGGARREAGLPPLTETH